MLAISDPADISEADAFVQPTPASGVASLQYSSLEPSSSLPGRLSGVQPSSSRFSSNTTSSSQQAQAALDANQPSPEKLQLPFGLSPTALSAELPQTALPSAHQPAHVPQPGTMSSATPLSGSVLSSAQSKRGLSLRDRLDSQRSGVSGQRFMLRWEPAQTSVDSPEKQELGRRKCLHVILSVLQLVQHIVLFWDALFLLYCLHVTEACFGAQVCLRPSHTCALNYICICMSMLSLACFCDNALFLVISVSPHKGCSSVMTNNCNLPSRSMACSFVGMYCCLSHQLWLIAALHYTSHNRHQNTVS